MATSFVRAGKGGPRALPPGTRPGLHGTVLTSSGLSDLDKILGGGLPLGTMLVVLEDSFAPHHLVLLRYFLAQGAAHRQALFFSSPVPSPRSFLATLPGLMTGGEGPIPGGEERGGKSWRASPSEPQEKADGLRIAWQYRRFISEQDALEARRQRQTSARPVTVDPSSTSESTKSVADSSLRLPHTQAQAASSAPSRQSSFSPSTPHVPFNQLSMEDSHPAATLRSSTSISSAVAQPSGGISGNDFCFSFDLRKPIDRPTLAALQADCVHMGAAEGFSTLHSRCSRFLSDFTRMRRQGDTVSKVGRVAIQSLGAPQSNPSSPSSVWAMLAWLHGLRRELQASQAVAMVTFPAALYSPSIAMRVQHVADIVISVEALHEDDKEMAKLIADFPDALGVLRVQKLPCVNTLVPAVLESCAFVMKVVRRRRIVFERMHPLPVEGGVPGGGGKAHSTSALLCGGPSNASSALDF